jgi:phosphatidylglycerophosphate synthase
MRLKIWLPNALSLSRIPASVGFLLVYDSRDATHYAVALAIALCALATDLADGYLARRWRVSSETGYFLDGLSDKAFYVSVVLVAVREEFMSLGLAWLLIGREVFLYALRSIDSHRTQNIERLKPLSKLYALVLRLYFTCFLAEGGFIVCGHKLPALFQYAGVLAYVAAAVGFISLINLICEIVQET